VAYPLKVNLKIENHPFFFKTVKPGNPASTYANLETHHPHYENINGETPPDNIHIATNHNQMNRNHNAHESHHAPHAEDHHHQDQHDHPDDHLSLTMDGSNNHNGMNMTHASEVCDVEKYEDDEDGEGFREGEDEDVKVYLDEEDRLVDANGEPHQILDEFDCARSIHVDADGKKLNVFNGRIFMWMRMVRMIFNIMRSIFKYLRQ
jgi:hypothetical protein